MRHIYIVAAVLLLAWLPAGAQSLVIRSIDTTDPSVVRARFYAFDADGELRRDISRSDLRVTEDGAMREVTDIRCPSSTDPQALSAVLCLDISGSMAGGAKGSNISIAQAAATAWVRGMEEDGEVGIVSFDDRGYVNHDLGSDTTTLVAKIMGLRPQGGTNYNAALLGDPSGALAIAREGKNKRIVVFLTDGRGNADEEKIVAAALRDKITVYCVTVGLPAPEVLKRIARRTGGEFFENVSTPEDARGIYRMILHGAQGEQPCEAIWRGAPACTPQRQVAMNIDGMGGDTITYQASPRALSTLNISTPSLKFGGVPPGTRQEMKVVLSAGAHPITIQRFIPVGNISRFTLDAPSTPFTIPANAQREVTVRFSPVDSGSAFARFGIVTDNCPGGSIQASGGYRGKPPLEPTIRLVRPNGGERFPVGDVTEIEWDGVLPTDTVRLEYSTDAGATWRTIAPTATGLKYRWTVPNTPSERCFARVEQIRGGSATITEPELLLSGHTSFLTGAFSDDGTRIATASYDGTAKIWDAGTGRLLRTLTLTTPQTGNSIRRAYYAEFSPDGTRLLTATDGGLTQLWDVANGRLLGRPAGWLSNTMEVGFVRRDGTFGPHKVFSPDGSKVLTVCLLPTDGGTRWNCTGVSIWDARNGRLIRRVGSHGDYVNSAQFSSDGRRIVTASQDSTARVFNVQTGAQELLLKGHSGEVRYAAFTPDGSRIVTAAYDATVKVWDARSGAEILTISQERARYMETMALSPDGSMVLIGYGGSGIGEGLRTYDVATGAMIAQMGSYNGSSNGAASFFGDGSTVISWDGSGANLMDARTGALLRSVEIDGREDNEMIRSVDGSRVAAGTNRRLGVWEVSLPALQSDRSDSLWAIISTQITAVDIDFGKQLIGSSRDSVISSAITNTGTVPARITDIDVLGAARPDFSIISGAPPFVLAPGESRAVEFRFDPKRTGKRTGQLEIRSGGATVRQTITGEGVVARLKIEPDLVDFGTIPVGEEKDTTVMALLKNEGTEPVEILGVVQLGPDSTQFAIQEGGGRFTIAPGASHAMELRFSAEQEGASSARLGFLHGGTGSPAVAHMFGRGERGEEFLDPTTFRTIAVPNAIIPRAGSIVGGVYDALGLMAGYAVTDNIMILAGGALPLPDDWGGMKGKMYGAYSIGVKGGIEVIDKLNVAVGYQWARSIFDDEITPDLAESQITASTFYGAISYGDDMQRTSVTFGHASKTHRRLLGVFDTTAAIVAVGSDYQFAPRWKICAEVLTMQTVGFIPVAMTARWFGKEWALDVGAAYVGITTGEEDAPEIPVVPVVSYVMRF